MNPKKLIIQNNMQENRMKSFTFAWILSFFDININSESSMLVHYSYTSIILILIALLCFINIIGYYTTLLLIQNNNYEDKYPRLKRLINYNLLK